MLITLINSIWVSEKLDSEFGKQLISRGGKVFEFRFGSLHYFQKKL